MTLDEAINNFTEAAKNHREEQQYWLNERDETSPLYEADRFSLADDSRESAEYYEQLAWDDIQTLNDVTVDDEGNCLIEDKFESCTECPLFCESKRYCGWRYQVDALMLIGKEGEQK